MICPLPPSLKYLPVDPRVPRYLAHLVLHSMQVLNFWSKFESNITC